VCFCFTAVPITKLFAWGEGDSGGHVPALPPRPVELTNHDEDGAAVFAPFAAGDAQPLRRESGPCETVMSCARVAKNFCERADIGFPTA
jgi:hypothetical protein